MLLHMDMLSLNTLLANCGVLCSNSMLDANMTLLTELKLQRLQSSLTKVNFTQFSSIQVLDVTGNDSGWNLDYLQLAGDCGKILNYWQLW